MDLLAQLVLTSVVWVPMVLILYWIIRLAVRHGTLDAYRTDRIDRRIAERSAAMARQQATHGGPEPE